MLVWDVEYINLPRITTFHSLRTKLNGELSALISAVQTPMHHAINDIASRQAKAWRNPRSPIQSTNPLTVRNVNQWMDLLEDLVIKEQRE